MLAVESTNAAMRIGHSAAWLRSTTVPSVPSVAAPTTSARIIIRRRSKRSAATPATRLKATSGMKLTAAT